MDCWKAAKSQNCPHPRVTAVLRPSWPLLIAVPTCGSLTADGERSPHWALVFFGCSLVSIPDVPTFLATCSMNWKSPHKKAEQQRLLFRCNLKHRMATLSRQWALSKHKDWSAWPLPRASFCEPRQSRSCLIEAEYRWLSVWWAWVMQDFVLCSCPFLWLSFDFNYRHVQLCLVIQWKVRNFP